MPEPVFSEIFEAMIQDHARNPRHFGQLNSPSHQAEGVNPLTGDRIDIQLLIDPTTETITDIAFHGKASALATTSASVLCGTLKGKTVGVAQEIIAQTIAVFEGNSDFQGDSTDEYDVLLEIRNVPHRIRCASLAWNTAASALENCKKDA